MSVNTKKVEDRRSLRFENFNEMLADAEQLAKGTVRTVGNWSYGQILEHLATTLDSSIDGGFPKAPFLMRMMASLLMKSKFLNKGLPAGFQIPDKIKDRFVPKEDVTIDDALTHLKSATERCKTETARTFHPVFGNMPAEDWDKFNLRHAELHMSFAHPHQG